MANTIINYAFSLPLLGKPDPRVPKPEGRDDRPRVTQKNSPDGACWFYAFNILRDRYNAPNTTDLEERKAEITFSALRKKIIPLFAIYNWLRAKINDPLRKARFLEITVKSCKESHNIQFLNSQINIFKKAEVFGAHVKKLMLDFENQDDNLHKFIESRIDHIFSEIYKTQLACVLELSPNIDQDFEEFYQRKWDEFPIDVQSKILNNWIIRKAKTSFRFTDASWSPNKPIKDLVDEIKKYGPLIVSGYFGQPYYKPNSARPKSMKIGDKAVWGWDPKDRLKLPYDASHVVIIVGAQETANTKLVFFIDPTNDDSNPKYPEKQRIYVMSYERLTAKDSINPLLHTLFYYEDVWACRRPSNILESKTSNSSQQ